MDTFINRSDELESIEKAFNALLYKNTLLSTPIIDFFGIDGIGKTRILKEIADRCTAKNLPCIKLDEKHTQLDGGQNTSRISRAIVRQAKKYWQQSPDILRDRKRDAHTQVVETIKVLLEKTPAVVILLDAIDSSNEALVNWIKTTLHELIEHNNLFVVLTSKQQIVFENDWLMTRRLTPLQLKPLKRDDCTSYLTSFSKAIPHETINIIFQWTRGYPSAMEVMTDTIVKRQLDVAKSEDKQLLITIIIEEIIDKKVLAHVKPPNPSLSWYKDHLRLLSIPRRFNLIIMQELLEKFGPPSISKRPSRLEYMGLQRQLNAGTDILYWDLQKAAFTLDESIRNIFFIDQQEHHPALFMDMHRYLAQRNKQLASEVAGSDSVRYLREYLYHSAQDQAAQTAEDMLQYIEHQFNTIASDVKIQFTEEFRQDKELREILEKHYPNVYTYIKDHVATEE
ncbi:MAG: ATP-binding protein [Chloroflexi bacterium]|nr:MAG: ATP-binding protein [Chloroflexota bacterium]